MGALRLEAMRAFAQTLATALPGVEIRVGQPVAAENLCLPSLAIHPTRFRYFPDEERQYREPDPLATDVVVEVGEHEATVQLALYTATPDERYLYEQKIIDLFLEPEGRPGVLMSSVSSDPDLGEFQAAWELEEEEWRDERAFDAILGSVLLVNAYVPALVKRTGVPTVTEMILAFTHDMTAPFSSTTLLPPAVETVEVGEDGAIS